MCEPLFNASSITSIPVRLLTPIIKITKVLLYICIGVGHMHWGEETRVRADAKLLGLLHHAAWLGATIQFRA